MIPFSPPHIDQKIIDEVIDTLNSGWITTGPKTKLFEKELTKYCGNKSTLCVNSATAGLELVLRWFGVGPGDEVIVPAYTYCATANVVLHCGAKPILVDTNANDFNISLEAIKNALSPRTKAIMPVDIGGLPCDYDKIMETASSYEKFTPANEVQKKLGRILVLSDSAHSIGATYKGRRTGSLSDISVFSFHAVKNLTTAEGGAIAFNLPEPFDNDEIYKYFCVFSLHGQNKDALTKAQKGSWKYDVVEPGYKANMTDIQASIGLVELSRYESDTLIRRKKIIENYDATFSKYKWAQLPITTTHNKISSFHLYLLRIIGISEEVRDKIIQDIFEQGVSVNVHFQPLPLLSAFKNLGYKMQDYPVAYKNFANEITLPVYYDLSDAQVEIVTKAVINSVSKIL